MTDSLRRRLDTVEERLNSTAIDSLRRRLGLGYSPSRHLVQVAKAAINEGLAMSNNQMGKASGLMGAPDCPNCDGTGSCPDCTGSGLGNDEYGNCDMCGGTGDCPTCLGSGRDMDAPWGPSD